MLGSSGHAQERFKVLGCTSVWLVDHTLPFSTFQQRFMEISVTAALGSCVQEDQIMYTLRKRFSPMGPHIAPMPTHMGDFHGGSMGAPILQPPNMTQHAPHTTSGHPYR